MKEIILAIALIILAAGCSSKNWHKNYNMSSDREAVLSAVIAMDNGSRGVMKGAANYLMSVDLTEEQANILSAQFDNMKPWTSSKVVNALVYHGYKAQAMPGIIKGLGSDRSGTRVNAINVLLMNFGCDGAEALPALKEVSEYDALDIEIRAKKTYRQISRDCLANKHTTEKTPGTNLDF